MLMENNLCVPPQNLTAEELVLGALLLDETAWDTVQAQGLQPEHFYRPAFRKIFQTMEYLRNVQEKVDLITVLSRLRDTKKLEEIGGVATLTNLLDKTISAINTDRYVFLVIDKAKRRKLISVAQQILALGYREDMDWGDIQKELEVALTEATSAERTERGLTHLAEILPQIYEEIEARKNNAIPTGLNQLDWYLNGGFRPSELVVVAGRPAMGKSFVGNFLANAIASTGKPVVFFTAEMDNVAIGKRFLGTASNLPVSKLVANSLTDEDMGLFLSGVESLAELPIYLDDTAGSRLTLPYIFSQCSKIKRQYGELGAVIVDYIQLLGDRASNNRVSEIGKYSAGLKELAKQFDTRVVALAQINREVEGLKDKRPSMSNLKDSGAIEQDADVILTLYREEYYNPDTPEVGILELSVVKNRNGQCGICKVEFEPEKGLITNLKQRGVFG